MRDFSFVQISDSHIGFNKAANTDVVGTLKQAIAKINALPAAPDFILHTGDLSHLSEAEEFDTLDQLLKSAKAGKIFYVPGEHDVISDNGKEFRARYGKGSKGNGWFSFDQRSEEHTSELQSHSDLVCRLLLEKKKNEYGRYTTDRQRV